MMPAFVIDLPGGGGKRLVNTYEKYDPKTGVATYKAPGLPGIKGQIEYTYYDPTSEAHAATEELHLDQAPKREMSLQESIRPTGPKQGPVEPLSDLFQRPSFTQNPGSRPMSATNKPRNPAVKPEDLTSHHLGISDWQQSSSAAGP